MTHFLELGYHIQKGKFNDRTHTHRGDDDFTDSVSNLLKNTRLSSAPVRNLCWTL
jgi:hypothetical protein